MTDSEIFVYINFQFTNIRKIFKNISFCIEIFKKKISNLKNKKKLP